MLLVFVFFVGYDVQSASTPGGVLYIAGAPRYNHTGRVVIYRLEGNNTIVTQILPGEQVSHFQCAVGDVFAAKALFSDLSSF